MKTIDIVKNRLIDRIMVTNNEQLLTAIENILSSTQTDDKLTLDSHQIEMLMMSERDIQQGALISESDLKEEDSKWIN
ncbi:hypothetical protein ACT3CD_16100 [Geofilum sp. OHC36d9]|uniref:hypothetical protein n=1 Tax=Geofilum sp. OHC36d9 TaxID=3458413 RepID=UPI00403361A3